MNLNLLSRRTRPVLAGMALAGLISATALAGDTGSTAPGRLIIVKAVYGDPNDASATADVTKQISGLVKNDAVTIAINNDNFEDPASGVSKRLKVDYTIDGVAGTKCAWENGTFRLSPADKPDTAKSSAPPKLIVRKAMFGDLPDGDANDVTSEVAKRVKDDALTVKPTSDDFGDPAPGKTKKLRVDYTFDGTQKSKTVDEGQTLAISGGGD